MFISPKGITLLGLFLFTFKSFHIYLARRTKREYNVFIILNCGFKACEECL